MTEDLSPNYRSSPQIRRIKLDVSTDDNSVSIFAEIRDQFFERYRRMPNDCGCGDYLNLGNCLRVVGRLAAHLWLIFLHGNTICGSLHGLHTGTELTCRGKTPKRLKKMAHAKQFKASSRVIFKLTQYRDQEEPSSDSRPSVSIFPEGYLRPIVAKKRKRPNKAAFW
jgi:hypothetical protein